MRETRPSERPFTPEEAELAARLYGLDTDIALELMHEIKETLHTFLQQVMKGAVVYDEVADKMAHGMITVMGEEFAKVIEETADSPSKVQLTTDMLHTMHVELMVFVAQFDTWAVFEAATYEDLHQDVSRILEDKDPATRQDSLKHTVSDPYRTALEELVAWSSRDEYL